LSKWSKTLNRSHHIRSKDKYSSLRANGSYEPQRKTNYSALSPKRREEYRKNYQGKSPAAFSKWEHQKKCLWYTYGVLEPTRHNRKKRKALMVALHDVGRTIESTREALGLHTTKWKEHFCTTYFCLISKKYRDKSFRKILTETEKKSLSKSVNFSVKNHAGKSVCRFFYSRRKALRYPITT